jgi:hypothetical protein
MSGEEDEQDDAFDSRDSETSSDSSVVISASDNDHDSVVQQPRLRPCLESATCPFVLTSDGLVCCTVCKIGVVPHPNTVASQTAHVKKFHKGSGFSVQEFVAKTVSEIQEIYDEESFERPPFEGFPVIEGFKCCVCGVVSSSLRTMRTHLNSHRDMQTSVLCHAIKVLVQRPFKWVNAAAGLSFQKAFIVKCDDGFTVGRQSKFHHLLAESQSQSWVKTNDSVHPTESIACLFKWGKTVSTHLPMLTGVTLAKLVQGSPLQDEVWFQPLLIHCQTYLQRILKSCVKSCEESGNYLILQMLRQETADSVPPARGFYTLQEDSLKCYSVTAVRLVAFLKRCKEDGWTDLLAHDFKNSMSCQAVDDYFASPNIKTLHAVFISLFCPTLTETTHDMSIHVCAFMRLASLNEHMVVNSPTRVMALTSRLKYLIRSAILIEVCSVGVYCVNALPEENRMRHFLRYFMTTASLLCIYSTCQKCVIHAQIRFTWTDQCNVAGHWSSKSCILSWSSNIYKCQYKF